MARVKVDEVDVRLVHQVTRRVGGGRPYVLCLVAIGRQGALAAAEQLLVLLVTDVLRLREIQGAGKRGCDVKAQDCV
jgi:hypothetical protein